MPTRRVAGRGRGRPRTGLPPAVGDALRNQLVDLRVLGSAVAVLLYVLARAVYVGFYDVVGIDPSEADHGRADILESAGLGLAYWLLCGGFLVTLFTSWRVARAHTQVAMTDPRVAKAALSWTLVLLALTPLLPAMASPAFLADRADALLTCSVVVLLVLAVALAGSSRWRPLAYAVPVLLLIAIVLMAERWGHFQADRVLDGRRVRPVPYFSLVDIRVERVCLAPKAGLPPSVVGLTRAPVSYLGAHGSVSLFLLTSGASRGQVLRLPSDDVYTVGVDAGGCP